MSSPSPSDFVPPPEAPVFEPTAEEFEDPMAYISKIRPVAEKAGICKIRPPPGWQPPFAVDVDNFRFTPRVQRLNELEAKTRIKLNFLDQLAKFWELQGVPLKIPMVDKKCADLYSLHKVVQDDGGFNVVNRNTKWPKIASRLGYSETFGIVFQGHYERILFPYDIFLAKVASSLETQTFSKESSLPQKREATEVGLWEQCGSTSDALAVKTEESSVEKRRLNYSLNSELKKLQFFGAGPKTALPDASVVCTDEKDFAPQSSSKFTRTKTRDRRLILSMENVTCSTCGNGENCENMLVCDGCDDVCHVYCLILPLADNQRNEWRCPKCIAKECRKPVEVYGFEQARREYTLQTFGQMADKFKIDYFNLPTHMVPCSVVEAEFWRLVNCIEEDVVVEYGADIHSSECGSGFPTEKTRHLFPDDDKYICSGWNLNNIPNLPSSVLRFINVDISGMKVPWCYVGMCFASFAWHIEDHWSSSINYLHWGEPKTWYGVPGAKAELLEECMRSNASELFEQSPDLLHQLTTIMNPNTLMQCGVPIVRTDQHAGEFVITFPRSYHSGFNQGYNFAEAVNFCAPEWLEMGRLCIDHYRRLKRQCVFSHEELICKMADGKEDLTEAMAVMVHQNLLAMIEEEKSLRKQVNDQGVVEAEHEAFELLPDDERQCDFCKTTCFLSAVTCLCSGLKLVCIRHFDKLCQCPKSKLCLRYRYTLDELLVMLYGLRVQLEDFDNWAFRAKTLLEARNDRRQDICKLKTLLKEAEDSHFPVCSLRNSLIEISAEADKCSAVANHLVGKKTCTRQREMGDGHSAVKLSLQELKEFLEEIVTLPCKIPEETLVQDLVKKVERFASSVRAAASFDSPDLEDLEKLQDEGVALDVDVPELSNLKQAITRIKWLNEVKVVMSSDLSWEAIRRLIDSGVSLSFHSAVEKALTKLQKAISESDSYDRMAKECLTAKPKLAISSIESVIVELKSCPIKLPSVAELCDALKSCKEWISKHRALAKDIPSLSVAESLVAKGRQIPILFDELSQLESQVKTSQDWKDQAANIFLKRRSQLTLLEVLSRRNDAASLISPSSRRRRRQMGSSSSSSETGKRDLKCFTASEVPDRDGVGGVQESNAELSAMMELRLENQRRADVGDLESMHCVCRRRKSAVMLQCLLCNDLFHIKCLFPGKNTSRQDVQSISKNFLCPLCLRSQRPLLSSLSSLLVAMADLPLQIPEADALKCLVEKTIAWQDRFHDAASIPDLAALMDDDANLRPELEMGNSNVTKNYSSGGSSRVSIVIPSAELCDHLEQLMVEGDLLEVTVDEKKMLRGLLRKFHSNYRGELFFFADNSMDVEDPVPRKMERRIVREQRKRPTDKDSKVDVPIAKPKRQRKLKQQPRVEDAQIDFEVKRIEETDDQDEEDDEDEECSAKRCLRPTSDHLEWIQCDLCEKWFHFLCIGLQKDDVPEHEDYECSACRLRRSASFSPVVKGFVGFASDDPVEQLANCPFQMDGFVLSDVVDISDSESYSDAKDSKAETEMPTIDADVIIVE